MKTHLLLLALIITILSYSQTYHPLLGKQQTHWSIAHNFLPVKLGQSTLNSTNPYFFWPPTETYATPDTTINSTKYYKVTNDSYTTADGGLREDTITQQVFYYDVYDSTEYLLYDFSLQKGDSVFITFKPNNNSTSLFISGWYFTDSTNTILTKNGLRKQLFLSNPLNPINDQTQKQDQLIWIESVGSTDHPIYTHIDHNYTMGAYSFSCNSFRLSIITCEAIDNSMNYHHQCIYDWYNSYPKYIIDSCHYILSGINEYSVIKSLNLYPNPAKSITTLTYEQTNNEQVLLEITSVFGQTIRSFTIPKSNGSNQIELNMKDLNTGLYFINLKGNTNTISKPLMILPE